MMLCVGYLAAAVAAVDLLVAVHRGRADGTRPRVLHPVHRDEPLHHLRHGHRRLLCAGDRHVHPLLAHLAGDGKAPEGSAQPAGWKKGQLQALQLQVASVRLNE
ncbi:hypothetical protein C0J52_11473 [Blattella germanica]|nr:hypothetical protein C0J52_11473 [Blattella germanica]